VVASRSTAITVKPARIPYSVAVKRPSFRKNLARTLSIRHALKQVAQPHYAAAQLNGQLKLNCSPKLSRSVGGPGARRVKSYSSVAQGESTD